MSWSTGFEAMMTQTITRNTIAGVSTDGYGTITYSTTAVSHKARIVHKPIRQFTAQGVEEVPGYVAWVKTTSTFTPSDQFTLPDGSKPRLLRAEFYYDSDGLHHGKLSFA